MSINFNFSKGIALAFTIVAVALMACGKQKYQNHADDESSDTPSETTIGQPNLRDALGLQGPVQYLGVFTEDDTRGDMNYDTYEFDRDGHLVSIDVAETVEGSYSEVMRFGDDGLPTTSQVTYINYWADVMGDNYPITITKYKIEKKEDGDYIKLTRVFESVEKKNEVKDDDANNEEQGEPTPIARVKLDKQGRIVEVEHIEGNPGRFTYTYADDKSNLARRDDGKLAIPQADIMGAKHFDHEGLQGQRATTESLTRGIWQFDIKNFE